MKLSYKSSKNTTVSLFTHQSGCKHISKFRTKSISLLLLLLPIPILINTTSITTKQDKMMVVVMMMMPTMTMKVFLECVKQPRIEHSLQQQEATRKIHRSIPSQSQGNDPSQVKQQESDSFPQIVMLYCSCGSVRERLARRHTRKEEIERRPREKSRNLVQTQALTSLFACNIPVHFRANSQEIYWTAHNQQTWTVTEQIHHGILPLSNALSISGCDLHSERNITEIPI